jgi:hypothetical protein
MPDDLLNTDSLADTVDAVQAVFFEGGAIPDGRRGDIARWIASRQGLSGSYRGLFAPTADDFADPIRVFTGEPRNSGAGTAYVLGQEAMTVLLRLGCGEPAVARAVDRADGLFQSVLDQAEEEGYVLGWYCCMNCTPAYWRGLAAGAYDRQEERLAKGLEMLRDRRDGKGRWSGWPFYYTLYALASIDLAAAREELVYAAPACERVDQRQSGNEPYASRRQALVERVLALV